MPEGTEVTIKPKQISIPQIKVKLNERMGEEELHVSLMFSDDTEDTLTNKYTGVSRAVKFQNLSWGVIIKHRVKSLGSSGFSTTSSVNGDKLFK